MTVIELKEKLEEFIDAGKGNWTVSVESFVIDGDECFYFDEKHKDINIG